MTADTQRITRIQESDTGDGSRIVRVDNRVVGSFRPGRVREWTAVSCLSWTDVVTAGFDTELEALAWVLRESGLFKGSK